MEKIKKRVCDDNNRQNFMSYLKHLIAFCFPFVCFWVPYSLPLFFVFINILLFMNLKKTYFLSLNTLFKHPVGILAFVWMLVTCCWAPDLWDALRTCGTIGSLSFLAYLSSHAFKNHLSTHIFNTYIDSVSWGFIFSLSLALVEMAWPNSIFHVIYKHIHYRSEYNRGLTLIIFFLPLFFYFIKSYSVPVVVKRCCYVLMVALYILIPRYDYDAGVLVMISLPILFILIYKGKKYAIKGLSYLTMGFVALAPLIPKYILNYGTWTTYIPQMNDYTWIHRLHIWNYVSRKIHEKPLIGWGINSSRHKIFQEKVTWLSQDASDYYIHITPSISLHPHNMALQIWLELGAVGACFMMMMIYFTCKALCNSHLSPFRQATYGTVFFAYLLFSHLSYGVWQSWYYTALCIVVALYHQSSQTNYSTQSLKV